MGKRLTLEIVKSRISPNVEILSKEYVNSDAKLDCKCKKCGYVWKTQGRNILKGCECPKCKGNVKHTMDYVKSRISPNVEILSKKYVKNNAKLDCKCKKCGYVWKTSAIMLRKGSECPKCRNVLPLTIEKIKARICQDIEIISESYKNIHSRLLCFCKKCLHKWETSADSLLQGSKCPNCSRTKLTIENIQNRISKNIKILSDKYKNEATKINCKCLKCDYEWVTNKKKLCRGSGCPRCGGTLKLSLQIVKDRLKEISPNIEIVSEVYEKSSALLNCKCLKCGNEWSANANNLINKRTQCPRCAKKESKIELDFLQQFKGWRKDRAVLKGRELDAYFEDKGFGVEVNGVYWHSEAQGKGRDYHLEKTSECEAQGIKLFHFFDLELQNKGKICKSMINNALGVVKRVFARECEVREISAKDAKEFCELNHIQGSCIDKVRFGLFASGELISVMTFGKSRYNKAYGWELLRFCSKVGYSVVGGASKLLKAFERAYLPQSLVSYGNRRWCNSVANVYKALGFEYKGDTLPNYFYIVDGALQNRQNYQRHKLNKIFNYEFNEVLTENEIMSLYGYERVYDCGNLIYCKEYSNGCA